MLLRVCHLTVILTAILLGAAGTVSCTTPAKPLPREALVNGQLRSRADGVLRSLETERSHFLRTRAPEALFAVFYAHVTRGILSAVDNRQLEQPDFWLDALVFFHADYARNRLSSLREHHWVPYYRKAGQMLQRRLHWWHAASPADLIGPVSLTALGVEAHIGTDLPRAMAQALQRHPGLRRIGMDSLARDFTTLSSVFPLAARQGFADLAPALPGLRFLPARELAASLIIGRHRKEAWQTFSRAIRQ